MLSRRSPFMNIIILRMLWPMLSVQSKAYPAKSKAAFVDLMLRLKKFGSIPETGSATLKMLITPP